MLLHRSFYEEHVPAVMTELRINSVAELEAKRAVYAMLYRMPAIAEETPQLKFLRTMKPLTARNLIPFWKCVEPNLPITDANEAEFCAAWQEEGVQCEGMRHKVTKKSHGIVRRVVKYGDIIVGTFKNGVHQGLRVLIRKNLVRVTRVQDGQDKARFAFRHDFTETMREDDKGLLNHLEPKHFSIVLNEL